MKAIFERFLLLGVLVVATAGSAQTVPSDDALEAELSDGEAAASWELEESQPSRALLPPVETTVATPPAPALGTDTAPGPERAAVAGPADGALATDEFDANNDFISVKYNAGPALVYDCLDRHWVCTGATEHQACQEKKAANIDIGRHELDCVPAKVFETKRDCYVLARQLVVRGNVPSACLNPKERKRFIGFR